jgi:hypothetical protein
MPAAGSRALHGEDQPRRYLKARDICFQDLLPVRADGLAQREKQPE